ncbi:hypothetical protein Pcinc_023257 [Petrolisthes cinctipes]|uniref:Uncharacterized protein n=1 Tax=Petrolisthes cinctipes TaxID=88211 RepID=A0AAE1FCM8_PETCI|nr:hypothetical protein Pcinc_023257 [Petrolisthes cinctipes]
MPRSYKREPVGAASGRGRGGYRIKSPTFRRHVMLYEMVNRVYGRQLANMASPRALSMMQLQGSLKYSGGQTVLSSEEETSLVESLLTLSQWDSHGILLS